MMKRLLLTVLALLWGSAVLAQTSTTQAFPQNVTVNGDLCVKSEFIVADSSGSCLSPVVSITTAGIGLIGDFYITGAVSRPVFPFLIDDSLNVTGAVSDPDSELVIDDALHVTGDISNPSGFLKLLDTVQLRNGSPVAFEAPSGSNAGTMNFDGTNILLNPNSHADNVPDFFVGPGYTAARRLVLGYDGAASLSTNDTNEDLVIDPDGTGQTWIKDMASGTETNVQVNAFGKLNYQSSARDTKKDIEPIDPAQPSRLLSVPLVKYRDINWNSSRQQVVGVLAEDLVAAGLTEFVVFWPDPDKPSQEKPVSVRYDRLVIYLLPILKDQQARIAALEAAVAALQAGSGNPGPPK